MTDDLTDAIAAQLDVPMVTRWVPQVKTLKGDK